LKSLSKQHYVSPYLIAVIYVNLAEQDQAFQWLEKAFEERDPYLTYLRVEPALDPLRSDTRFRDLVNRMDVPSMESSQPAPFSSEGQITKAAKE